MGFRMLYECYLPRKTQSMLPMYGNWRDKSFFPKNLTKDWIVQPVFGRRLTGKSNVDRAVDRWEPMQGILVSLPSSDILLPPVCVTELAAAVLEKFKRRMRLFLSLWVSIALILSAMSVRSEDMNSVRHISSALWAMTAAIVIDYFVFLRRLGPLQERALFFYWIQSSNEFRRRAAFVIALFLVSGGIQLMLQHILGGFEPTVISLGNYFPAVKSGEWWRLMTGPMLHASVAHFFANLSLAAFFIPLCLCFGRKIVSLSFAAGIVISGLLQIFLGAPNIDSMAGVSGGLFSILGTLILSIIFVPEAFPSGFAYLLTGITIATGLAASAIGSASNIAHVAGFGSGVVVAVFWWTLSKPRLK